MRNIAVEGTTPCRWFVLFIEVQRAIYGRRTGYGTCSNLPRRCERLEAEWIEKEVIECGSADRQVLALR